jgi:hypothetical protein
MNERKFYPETIRDYVLFAKSPVCTDSETAKEALQKCTAFRQELISHNISWQEFIDYGFVNDGDSPFCLFVGMGKHNSIYDYQICQIDDDGIHSGLDRN